ncbi:hypothetical protein NCAS_0A07030 [Naumovozyma castellii]|uniref:Clathrin light chain n=1 Tax=Naumovozyma castellii TaxID=27288 RepID=G0V713_NAUCA|nr:hypothetical protein NCAS_0A07030 [Naumovozyma castellii CBS 4309]CCC67261.1 hypothetical protein NCAS_0A07030 [Naumovozyma castellii CBS 4309]
MSEKFPPLENEKEDDSLNVDVEQEGTDFLQREAAALGNEFATEQDAELFDEPVEAKEEIKQFENQYPDIHDVQSNGVPEHNDEFYEMQSNAQESANAAPSEAVTEWRERRVEEIKKLDEANEKAKGELQDEAVKHIDNFYEDYNRKKEQQIEVTQKEAEEFLKERDQFFQQDNTTWDRVLQLINTEDADSVAGRDRSKFKEILQRLKGKTDAPGA